jgi:predicted transcriptional regulator
MWMMSKQLGIDRQTCRATLGPLEAQVMEVLWAAGECSVRQVLERLPRKMAYTTVMTTLVRLAGKNMVQRRMRDSAFFYSPRLTANEWQRLAASEAVARLLSTPSVHREVLIASLLDTIFGDRMLLSELERRLEGRSQQQACPRTMAPAAGATQQ